MELRSILKPAKDVPITWWSSKDPMEPRPKPSTLLILCVGLWIFGTGDAVIVAAGVGNTPWTVLAEGIALMMGRTIGQATFFVSVAVLFLWIPLREKPGIGTILNAILIAVAIEYMLPILPTPEGTFESLLQVIGGIALVGIGSGIYLTANLGPGPRDGWMTGMQRVSGYPIGNVRAAIEISVVIIGWSLDGTIGIGTVIFAVMIGPTVAICLNIAGKIGRQG
ncbi:MAG: YczE/YyaS/YitT family protein [Candidatus Thalassarchaeaceae archaeon]|nr:hypothetical protein [Euryarchaeota archaeon]OUW79609.1 MAG: hypothetical protein CBD75_00255 [Euryarchaeota archaeon TMED215]|tara:strand:- start:1106 stop:1774 length:669 start_codon:yes stop_codon:yes gene_type:complete